MSFPRYPAYKPRGVEWLGEVPEHWEEKRIRFLLKSSNEGMKIGPFGSALTSEMLSDDGAYKVYGQENIISRDFSIGTRRICQAKFSELSAYQVQARDVLVTMMGTSGRCDVVPIGIEPGIMDSHLLRMRLEEDRYCIFLKWLIDEAEYVRIQVRLAGKGSIMHGLNSGIIKDLLLVLPPLCEQGSILEFLDHETAKIDALIAEQQRLIDLAKERIKTLALSGYQCPSSTQERIGRLVKQISRPVSISNEMTYEPLGLYNRGRGLFHKEVRAGNEMGDSDFFMIENGDLILSGQFAWEGAVALASSNENGCVVSHRYPVIRGRSDRCHTEFLLALLWTDHGDFLLNQCSRGAAGRNRPLNLDLLLKEEIRVPDLSIQELIKSLVWKLRALQEECISQQNLASEHKKALISAAVTGQIDVRGLVPEAVAA